jgi:hypothetical protein
MAPQPLSQVVRRQPYDSNHFPLAFLAGRYGNGGSREVQKICQKFNAGLVGSAFNRWRGQRQFQSVSEFTRNCILSSARMDLDSESSAGRSVLNRDHANRSTTEDTEDTEEVTFPCPLCPPWLLLRPFPKDCGSYAHAGGAFFYRNFKIMRHAHG